VQACCDLVESDQEKELSMKWTMLLWLGGALNALAQTTPPATVPPAEQTEPAPDAPAVAPQKPASKVPS
jgi:hypothetical protein